jgi:uncharacterized protein YjbI with pentapeptide repeats
MTERDTGWRVELRADCARCVGLCCVAPAFAASADFAINKPAGHPCPNLRDDYRCGIHHRLRGSGFPGCTVFDCLGAGQRLTQQTFGGRSWREPDVGPAMVAAFPAVRQLHELLWYVHEALDLPAARPVHPDLRRALADTEHLAGQDAATLGTLDVDPHRRAVNTLLLRASELARATFARARVERDGTPRKGTRARDAPGKALRGKDAPEKAVRGRDMRGVELRGADLAGRDLGGADLRGASLRGAYLIGTNLRGANLELADVTGADLRGADLSGATLTGTLFLLQAQLDAAHGDAATALPSTFIRPAHW